MATFIMDGLEFIQQFDLNEFLETFSTAEPKTIVVEDSTWIQLQHTIPEWDDHFINRTIDDINVIYQSPSRRYILDIGKDDENEESLALYISDLIDKTLHRYDTSKITIDCFVGGYLLTETHMVIVEYRTDSDNFMQHFVLLDHTKKLLVPKAAYVFPADPNMEDHEVVASPLIINKEAFCVIKGIGIFQFIPFWPKTNPYNEPTISTDFRIEYSDFRFGNYEVQREDATVCGHFMFMIIDGIYIDDEYIEKATVDKMACIDLSHRTFRGTFNIDEHNLAPVSIVEFKKVNFDEVENEELHYYTDANLLVYIKDDEKNRPVPYYVVNLEDRTVTKVNTSMSNYGFPLKFDNSVLQIRFKKRCTSVYREDGNNRRRRREVENILEYKLIRYNVPSLFQLCRDYVISTDFTKNLSEKQKNMLF